jgi:hypothetical protein
MIKAKFRDHVRSKTETAMKNEVLAKILCHNLCCLIMSQIELGIEPVFWGEVAPKPAQAEVPQAIVAPAKSAAPAVQPAAIRRFQMVGA